MPKLHCPCGYVHNLSPIPDDGWITIADRYYEDVIDTEAKRIQYFGEKIPAPDNVNIEKWRELTSILIKHKRKRLYHCPECGRIMWDKTGNGQFDIFRPDEPNNSS